MQQEEDEKEIKKKKINGPITWAVEEKRKRAGHQAKRFCDKMHRSSPRDLDD